MGLFHVCHVLKKGLLLCALFWTLVFTILATDPVAEGLATTPSVSLQEAGEQLYLKHVRPLFEERCQMCHTGESGQGGFDLSTAEGLLRGGKRGQAVIPGNAGGSLLYKLVTHAQEPVMPQKAPKLSPEAIALIEFWINVGAPTGSAASITSSTASNPPVVALAENALSPAVTLFAEKIRPILQEQCLACHGGKFKQAGLTLATRDGLLRGSDNGPVVVPGKAGGSLLLKKLRHEHEPGMPYKAAKLSDEVIAHFVSWVDAGTPYDRPLDTTAPQTVSQEQKSDHWAFRAPVRPAVPEIKNSAWVRNPIDAFVAAKHEERKLKPLPSADKRMLLRRVSLDLTGLPPTQEEMRAFLGDRSPDAYEKVVDRLLASPRYGERWGRHWMDIWRYSDWYGFGSQIRNSQHHIWHWRDWIIESLNRDKGYDRMILEMLAADEIAPKDLDTVRATGYLARNWYRFNRNVWLQDTVEHTAAGFLAITLKCARCHDHKYDPIAQEEYYRFRAFFEPYDVRLDRAPGEADLAKDGIPRVYDAEPREATTKDPFLPGIFAETYRFIRGDERSPDKEHPLSPGVPEALGNRRVAPQPIQLPIEAFYPARRPYVSRDLIAQARKEVEQAEANLVKTRAALAETQRRLAAIPSDTQGAPVIGAAAHPEAPDPSRVGPSPVDFDKEIKPIFEKNCVSCHRAGNARSGLALDSIESIREGGKVNGPAVIPRKGQESPLLLYLQGKKKPRMPFGSAPLPDSQIALIQNWIEQLPEERPQVALRKAEGASALAEKQLASARAALPALEARIAAENAKYAEPPDPQAEQLAKAARQAERHFQLLKAEENLLKAQQKLAEALSASNPSDEKAEKERDKKVAAARKELEAAQAALSTPQKDYTPLGESYPKTSSGRRLALARWIASPDNPLTARVAVNHIWMRHFGNPLVPTVVNFGLNGKSPSHPELLDWLACELVENDWSMKAIHRLMVTSNTYRMQSSTSDLRYDSLRLDPENIYLWRMNPRRMEGEAVRDSLLSVAGQLDTSMGGTDLDESQAEHVYRRSLYFRHTPDSQAVFLKLFDAPDPTDCYKRDESIVPQQALALANSKLSRVQSRLLARKIAGAQKEPMRDSAFVQTVFERILGRLPTSKEQAESESFLREQTSLFQSPGKLTALPGGTASEVPPATEPAVRAKENLVHVLFSHNDFVTVR
jgi:mono/diheme cytochrome c family protein